MSENIVTTNCTLDLGTFTAASKTISCSKSCKADGNEIYYGTMTVTLTTVTDESKSVCALLEVKISPSAQKTKINSTAVLLEGDSGSAKGTFVNATTKEETVETVTVTIKSAGQSIVKGV